MAPAKRQRTLGPAQSTLSFSRSKPTHTTHDHIDDGKVSKPASAKPTTTDIDVDVEIDTKKPAVKDLRSSTKTEEPQNTTEVLPEVEVESDESEEEDEHSPDDAAARALSEKQITAYWSAKERGRTAPRVHQGGLGTREKVLREFDMQTRFGVCFYPCRCHTTTKKSEIC